jgi:hypothetical protein
MLDLIAEDAFLFEDGAARLRPVSRASIASDGASTDDNTRIDAIPPNDGVASSGSAARNSSPAQ